ncbi:hypothetical protein [Hyunsoonleella ulvae]|uniref:hypothetical protein n=1 Tax=Hyunsoonleella ulvae TaxID=2799948 RepID=UPI001939E030|nr:hypothetical protein [Hyunsoonleella ulvae]
MITEEKNSGTFPYKALIWALVAVLALFLFKYEIKQLLIKSDELSIFGINVKSGSTEILMLTDSINAHKNKIVNLVKEIESQEAEIKNLEQLKNQLEENLNACPETRENTTKLSNEYSRIYDNNISIKRKAELLKATKIITNFNMEQ